MHRGAWYYSAEQNLGFCGAIRSAATILADDPIFGRFCYGGAWQQSGGTNQVVPLDGVRKRFHAMLNNCKLHLVLNSDRFAAGQPIVLQSDLSQVSFQIESENTAAHSVTLHFTSSTAATYTFSSIHGVITTTESAGGTGSRREFADGCRRLAAIVFHIEINDCCIFHEAGKWNFLPLPKPRYGFNKIHGPTDYRSHKNTFSVWHVKNRIPVARFWSACHSAGGSFDSGGNRGR